MGRRQNRVVPILLLENYSASVGKDAHSNVKNTKNFVRTQTVNFRNLIHVNCTKEQKSHFTPTNFCLLNARSVNRKELSIKDYVSENDIDILAITETWLQENNNDFSIAEMCPTGYQFHHVRRKNTRGGGVGLLLKKHIKVKKQSQKEFSSFEYLDVTLNNYNIFIRTIIIYRPPPSKVNNLRTSMFFKEFCTFLEQVIILSGNILIAGDFNFHVDNTRNSDTITFNKILESFNLQQHVNEPTHKQGHTLDLIITRNEDKLVNDIKIHDPVISDHMSVHCTLQLQKPQLQQTEINNYRKLNDINMSSFNQDLEVLNFDDDYDLPILIDKYENTLKETLQKHAPLKRRLITIRPSSPWYNEEIGKEKRKRRRLERRWRTSGLCIDRQLYVKQCEVVNTMIKKAKTTYYTSIISNNAHNQKVLFKTVDKLLHRKPEKQYPTASSTIELANKFADFFSNKITAIRNELVTHPSYNTQSNQEE